MSSNRRATASRRLPWAILVALAVSSSLAACHRAHPTDPYPPSAAPPSKEMRRAAMLSVYFHSRYASSHFMPEELQPIDLLEAARILRAYEGRFAESRRRRAIARLAAAGMDHPKRRQALEILGAPIPDLERLIASLTLTSEPVAAEPPGEQPPPTPGVKGAIIAVSSTTLAITSSILKFLSDQWGPAIANCEGSGTAETGTDPKSGGTTATVHGEVKRDLAEVCVAMDPQNWDDDDCSDYFTTTHIAVQTGGSYTIKKDYSVDADPQPPAACSPYKREIYELFEIRFVDKNKPGSVVMAWYKQLLSIDSHDLASVGSEGHAYDYSLYKAIRSQVGIDERDGGLKVNEGYVRMERRKADPAWTDLELVKTVLFSDRPWLDPFLNLWADVTLLAMGDELPEMACCQP